MAAPLISVIMPVYNSAATLAAAARSILRQTVRDWELIIIDDGSADDSFAVAQQLQDRRIRLFRNEGNLGASRTRNRGIELARGAFFAPMDADDVCRPRRLELTLRYLEAHPKVGACGGWGKWIGWGSRSFVLSLPTEPEAVRAYMLFGAPYHHDALLIRKALLDEHRLRYPEAWHAADDYGLFRNLVAVAPVANLPRVMVDYFCSKGGITNRRAAEATGHRLEGIRNELARLVEEPISDEVLRRHAYIGNGGGASTVAELDEFRAWLLGLEERNRIRSVYSEQGLAQALGMTWFRVCRNSAHLGKAAWQAWRQSPWNPHYCPMVREIASFGASMALAATCPSRRVPQGKLGGL
jgi:glycosyltransferase involved in cell wall biosynthesis